MLISCNGDKNNANANISQHEKIIPYREDSIVKNDRQQLYLKNVGETIGLPLISNGKDGLYIRIWIWGFRQNYVVNISKGQKGSECLIVQFSGKKIDSNEYLVIHKQWDNLIPKSGWKIFFDTLEMYQIPVMKSGKRYEDQTDFLTHMTYIQFEIAQLNHYRFYEYLEPSYYRYVDTGSRNVYEFLEYFNREMGVQVYNPAQNLFVKPK
jgi:hypothetical protein